MGRLKGGEEIMESARKKVKRRETETSIHSKEYNSPDSYIYTCTYNDMAEQFKQSTCLCQCHQSRWRYTLEDGRCRRWRWSINRISSQWIVNTLPQQQQQPHTAYGPSALYARICNMFESSLFGLPNNVQFFLAEIFLVLLHSVTRRGRE